MPKPPKIEPKTLQNRGLEGVRLKYALEPQFFRSWGGVLGRPGGVLGASWAHLGNLWASWERLGAVLRRLGNVLGRILMPIQLESDF